MSIWTVCALICIILGFVGAIIDEAILFNTLTWFVAAIAFNTLAGGFAFTWGRKGES